MIERNSKVKIVASSQLTEMMLEELVGKTGVGRPHRSRTSRLQGIYGISQRPVPGGIRVVHTRRISLPCVRVPCI